MANKFGVGGERKTGLSPTELSKTAERTAEAAEQTADRRGAGGGPASSAKNKPTSRRQSQRGSKTFRIPGERAVKEYPVTRDELLGLSAAGLLATGCFSYGGVQLNRAFDIGKDLELTQALPEKLVGRWEAKREDALFWGVLLIVLGVILLLLGGAKVWSIISSTSHAEE